MSRLLFALRSCGLRSRTLGWHPFRFPFGADGRQPERNTYFCARSAP